MPGHNGGETLKRLMMAGLMVVAGISLTACGAVAKKTAHDPKKIVSGRNLRWKKAPPLTIRTNKTYVANFSTTAGDFKMTLFAKLDPYSANNFVFLADHHFYNGDIFFRVLQPFMIQTGDPLNTGVGGPGYSWPAELPPTYPYAPGIVAMAHTEASNSNGSQFFICTGAECADLNSAGNNTYTEVGRITQGMAVVDKIAAGKVVANPNMPGDEVSKPVHPVTITNITIAVS